MKDEDLRTKYEYNPEQDKIGEGAYGTVYRAIKKDTKEKRVIKLIDIKKYKTSYQDAYFKSPSDEEIQNFREYIIKEIEYCN